MRGSATVQYGRTRYCTEWTTTSMKCSKFNHIVYSNALKTPQRYACLAAVQQQPSRKAHGRRLSLPPPPPPAPADPADPSCLSRPSSGCCMPTCEKNATRFSTFPMFVPSLSWQKDNIYICMYMYINGSHQNSKSRFRSCTLRRIAGTTHQPTAASTACMQRNASFGLKSSFPTVCFPRA